MRDLIIWKILLIGFHFDIRDNKVSNLLKKMPQSHTLEVQNVERWKLHGKLMICKSQYCFVNIFAMKDQIFMKFYI